MRSGPSPEPAATRRDVKVAALHVDLVCGMRVDPARAAGHVEHQETTYYFCSKGCVAKFSADPERYLRPPERERHPDHGGGACASPPALGTDAPRGTGNVPC